MRAKYLKSMDSCKIKRKSSIKNGVYIIIHSGRNYRTNIIPRNSDPFKSESGLVNHYSSEVVINESKICGIMKVI